VNLEITMTFLRHRRGDQDTGLVHVCAYEEISPGEIRRVEGVPAVLCRTEDRLYALSWVCPHSAAKLAKGRIVDSCLECPLHGARFALHSGEVRTGPAKRALTTYGVEVRDGEVYVRREADRPGLLTQILRALRR
jgi:3-phenylpropionate/trans-cinnamate dioxygenase ferredoxin component